ncbi:TetR/AcrR family transcriptional regulator [Oceanibium sediminis]|uniref:TetR/AcrR family transcriptional regulator n=1 Tax=Oceanibium sediminis TaxID=2026339 RepID=UPI0013008492|nr:TetR/AcrR family transcriptional regulator [Oceanibium sediminis]
MPGKSAAGQDQVDTAAKVEEAVLDMIQEQGVLNGINLNDVAKAAGVSRTLVYHHFGSRRALLRSAIKHELNRQQVETKTPTEPMRLGARVAHGLRSLLASGFYLRLTTLLHLDGSTAPRLMPNAETTLLRLERDHALGLVPETDDLPALHASYAAAVYGYALFREIFARDLGIDVEELDVRVAAQLEKLYDPVLPEGRPET